MKKLLIISLLIILIFNTNISSSATVSYTQSFPQYETSLSGQSPNLSSQIILRIPFTALYNVRDITSYRTYAYCYSGYENKPVLPMHIRFYIYENDNPDSGDYYLQDNVNIYNNSCTDYGTGLLVNLISTLNIEELQDTNYKGIAFGFWTESEYMVNQNWFFPYNIQLNDGNKLVQSWNNTLLPYSMNTNDINNNYIYALYDNNNLIQSSKINVYGNFIYPPTPLPTPTVLNPIPTTLPCNGCGQLPGDEGGGGTPPNWYDINWSEFNTNNTTCPDCLGNESSNFSNTITKESGFCNMILSFGYGNVNGCDAYDFIDFLYDYSNYFFLISLLTLGYKINLLYKRG